MINAEDFEEDNLRIRIHFSGCSTKFLVDLGTFQKAVGKALGYAKAHPDETVTLDMLNTEIEVPANADPEQLRQKWRTKRNMPSDRSAGDLGRTRL